MSIPYETATAGDRAINEMQKTLSAFGCQSFGTMTDNERQVMIVAFKWRDRQVHLEASWKGYAAALLKNRGHLKGYGETQRKREQKALEQARVSVCSVLRDWVKGQTTAVESVTTTGRDQCPPDHQKPKLRLATFWPASATPRISSTAPCGATSRAKAARSS